MTLMMTVGVRRTEGLPNPGIGSQTVLPAQSSSSDTPWEQVREANSCAPDLLKQKLCGSNI